MYKRTRSDLAVVAAAGIGICAGIIYYGDRRSGDIRAGGAEILRGNPSCTDGWRWWWWWGGGRKIANRELYMIIIYCNKTIVYDNDNMQGKTTIII